MTTAGPAPLTVALEGRCPRCGARGLFAGMVKFAPACPACGLDYSAFNVGDGAVPFLVFIVGAIVVVGAVWLQLGAHPPFWVHLAIWPLLTLGLTIALTRVARGLLLALEYRHKAGEGRA
jgi:uncharacterized protein (DUF983 family)